MKNLKVTREKAGMTQTELAKVMNKTQQTIGRWESGKSEPNIDEMFALATLFRTSVDALLGREHAVEVAKVDELMDALEENKGEYEGNLGLRTPGTTCSKWYPTTENELDRISSWMNSNDAEGRSPLLVTHTLNNKVLFINPDHMDKISLLRDTHGEFPVSDWVISKDEARGAPIEFYKKLADYHDVLTDDADAPEEEFPQAEREAMVQQLNDWDVEIEEEALFAFLFETRVFTSDGKVAYMSIEPEDLHALHTFDSQEPQKMVRLFDVTSQMDTFTPWKKIAMIEAPLVSLLQYWEDLEWTDTQADAAFEQSAKKVDHFMNFLNDARQDRQTRH